MVRQMAGMFSWGSKFLASCRCMVSDIWEVDIHGLRKKLAERACTI